MQDRVEHALERTLPAAEVLPQSLHRAMRYAVLGGGKRVRPLLAYATGAACGIPDEVSDHVAVAVELIHAYSLIHDDLPCMDDDVLRRGKPTCHVEFGEATALLAGDALQSLAFHVLAQTPLAGAPQRKVDMVRMFSVACGSRGMAGGQAIDLDSVGKELSRAELEQMHLHKTGELIRASVMLAATCADHDEGALRALDRYAKSIGLAFQVVDDILDSEASTATLGKTAGKDAAQDKPTFVSVLGSGQAKALAASLRDDAHTALRSADLQCGLLADMADFIVLRHF